MERLMSKAVRMTLGGLALAGAVAGATAAMAQGNPQVIGKIEWGVWVDDDGCMHWWADGGLQGYMVPRRDPRTGKPVCLRKSTCLVENADALFQSGTANLTAQGQNRLRSFFQSSDSVGFSVSRADAYNSIVAAERARAIGGVAASVGAQMEPVAGGRNTVTSSAKNQRVEIACYRW